MTITNPGIYRDIDFRDYQSIPAVNASALKVLTDGGSIRDMGIWMAQGGQDATDAMRMGTLLDEAVIERKKIHQKIIIKPKMGKGEGAKKEYQARMAAANDLAARTGRVVVDGVKVTHLKNQIDSLFNRCHEDEHDIVFDPDADRQLTIVWEEPETGLLCKGRLDLFHGDTLWITDLKSSKSVKDFGIRSAMLKYGYHLSISWYVRGMEILLGEDAACNARFVFSHNLPNYAWRTVPLAPEAIEEGYSVMLYHLKRWAEHADSAIEDMPSMPPMVDYRPPVDIYSTDEEDNDEQ